MGGGISVAIPAFLHLKSFNDFYEIVDVYKISETEPILDCNDHGLHYKIYLTAKEGGSWDARNAKDNITLSVVDVKDSSNLSWGGTRQSNKHEHWTNWKLRITNKNEAHLQIPDTSQSRTFADQYHRTLSCKNNKIVSKLNGDGQEVNVVANSSGISSDQKVISFELQASNACIKSGKRTECEISFKEDNNLDWKSGFKPKAYFYL